MMQSAQFLICGKVNNNEISLNSSGVKQLIVVTLIEPYKLLFVLN